MNFLKRTENFKIHTEFLGKTYGEILVSAAIKTISSIQILCYNKIPAGK